MRGAARNVKKVALELGGKSPNIVFADADFETAVDNALTAAFVHSGQVCSAGCRAIVESPIHDRFVAALAERADRIRLGRHRRRHGDRGAYLGRIGRRSKAMSPVPSRRARAWSPAVDDPTSPSCSPILLSTDRHRRCAARHAHRPRGGLRAGAHGGAVRNGGRGDRARQRHRLRPGRRRLDGRCVAGAAGRRPVAGRHGVDQRLQRVHAEAGVGRLQALGHRSRAGPPSGLDEYREAKHIWQNTAPARAAGSRARRAASPAAQLPPPATMSPWRHFFLGPAWPEALG